MTATSMTMPTQTPMFNLSFESGANSVRDALQDIRSALSPLSLDGDELGTIEIVLAEALNNVVEHAYPEGDPAGPIALECNQHVNGLHFTLRDKGRPMPDGQIPMGQQADLDVEIPDLPEGGFGWFLIQDLAKDLDYRRIDDQNVLGLRVAVVIPA